jgi:predicted membrane protein
MHSDTDYVPRRRGLRILGWSALVLGLPLAFIAILHAPNEYHATIGIDALDCDGPFETYMFALPVLLIYGVGLAINGSRWRKRLNAAVALLCFAICTAVVVNVARAVAEDQKQATACR